MTSTTLPNFACRLQGGVGALAVPNAVAWLGWIAGECLRSSGHPRLLAA